MITHNKKRNINLLIEFLKKSITTNIVDNQDDKAKEAYKILKKHFLGDNELRKEAKLNNIVYNTILAENIDDTIKLSIIEDAYKLYNEINKIKLEKAKNNLIREINYKLGKNTYNFNIDNYRLHALVNSFWNLKNKLDRTKHFLVIKDELDKIKNKEKELSLTRIDENIKTDSRLLNKYTMEILVKKYNDHIKDLLPEQKNVVKHYINYVFCQNSPDEFGGFVIEEKKKVIKEMQNIRTKINNKEIKNKIDSVCLTLESTNTCPCNGGIENTLKKIMEIYDLINNWKN